MFDTGPVRAALKEAPAGLTFEQLVTQLRPIYGDQTERAVTKALDHWISVEHTVTVDADGRYHWTSET